MESNHTMSYDVDKSSERMDEILNASDNDYCDKDSIPARSDLTFKNGYYVNVTAIFIDIVGSSDMTDEHKRPTLAKMYRAFLSECVAIMNAETDCKEININGDCVWGVFDTPYKSDVDEVYASIYRQAKVSIYVVDNYIGLRTLVHLKNSQSGVSIILFSDNVGNNKLHNIEFTDFCKEYPNVKISMQKTGEIFHDRFIVLDYGTADERVFLCGASSKDAGARITSIVEDYGTKKYASVMATLLQNPPLVLPK